MKSVVYGFRQYLGATRRPLIDSTNAPSGKMAARENHARPFFRFRRLDRYFSRKPYLDDRHFQRAMLKDLKAVFIGGFMRARLEIALRRALDVAVPASRHAAQKKLSSFPKKDDRHQRKHDGDIVFRLCKSGRVAAHRIRRLAFDEHARLSCQRDCHLGSRASALKEDARREQVVAQRNIRWNGCR